MRANVDDIARLCGVSRGTVDRALHNRSGISEKTRKHILETAKSLNYRPNALARGLVSGKSQNIGFVALSLNNHLIAELATHIETEARLQGFFTFIINTELEPAEESECIEHLCERYVDGIILQSVKSGAAYTQWLESLSVPVVAIGNRISTNIPFVGINDRLAAREAVEHMQSLGYEDIAIICPPLRYLGIANIDAAEQRYLGYLEAMNRNRTGDTLVVREKDLSKIMDFLRNGRNTKKGIFCTSDVFALEMIEFLQIAGFSVPEDVGVMGFDKIEILKYIRPRLTTVDQGAAEIGRKAVKVLLDRINNITTQNTIQCSHTIIKGETII